jgi:TonB family protein
MNYLRLPLGYLLCLALFGTAENQSKNQIVGEPTAQLSSLPIVSPSVQHLTSSPSEGSQTKTEQSPTLDLSTPEKSIRPAVIWVTVFDSTGKALRTETGFFISDDGRFITTAHAVEGGVNAVAKMTDGGIYKVSGLLATSTALDLAIIQADVKQVPFLALNKNANLPIGTRVGVVGSGLAGPEEGPREVTVTAQQSDRLEIAGAIFPGSIGSPVVDAHGEVVGIVISAGETAAVRPSSTLNALLSQIASDAVARWPEAVEALSTPHPMLKPQLVYAPPPAFPSEARSRPGVAYSGRFLLSFDAHGNVTTVRIIQSTGNELFDETATSTLQRWKAAPGREGAVTVPITFEAR